MVHVAGSESSSIKSAEYTEFENEIPYGLIVYVDSSKYKDNVYDGAMANVASSTYLGTYQIIMGVASDQWRVHVIVKDYMDESILSEDYYPTDRN